ncbi:unnamed protein product [Cyclocybe aegerita]|uniref:Uncharacterized protein n=1 Tax=Cyclocybe aegerita TaxID=1973307 RepID=A0A8S0W3M7_CYCAE|nr:unnamed protein product [Cyclocybe aegerita]
MPGEREERTRRAIGDALDVRRNGKSFPQGTGVSAIQHRNPNLLVYQHPILAEVRVLALERAVVDILVLCNVIRDPVLLVKSRLAFHAIARENKFWHFGAASTTHVKRSATTEIVGRARSRIKHDAGAGRRSERSAVALARRFGVSSREKRRGLGDLAVIKRVIDCSIAASTNAKSLVMFPLQSQQHVLGLQA